MVAGPRTHTGSARGGGSSTRFPESLSVGGADEIHQPHYRSYLKSRKDKCNSSELLTTSTASSAGESCLGSTSQAHSLRARQAARSSGPTRGRPSRRAAQYGISTASPAPLVTRAARPSQHAKSDSIDPLTATRCCPRTSKVSWGEGAADCIRRNPIKMS